MSKLRHENDMAARSNESQNPQVDTAISESCEPSDAVSAQGDGKDKKAGKSRQTDKKEAYAIKGGKLSYEPGAEHSLKAQHNIFEGIHCSYDI
ncbi:MAG: hypothetical protein LBU32_19295 [Clostridiales bacterium]|nr:hypothetical protein [Clostridiales bacterium]